MTPIHAAIQNVHIKCVGILLQYGSDLHCSYAECPTVLAFARYHGNKAILRLIEAFMDDNGMGHHQPAQNYNAIIMVRRERGRKEGRKEGRNELRQFSNYSFRSR